MLSLIIYILLVSDAKWDAVLEEKVIPPPGYNYYRPPEALGRT